MLRSDGKSYLTTPKGTRKLPREFTINSAICINMLCMDWKTLKIEALAINWLSWTSAYVPVCPPAQSSVWSTGFVERVSVKRTSASVGEDYWSFRNFGSCPWCSLWKSPLNWVGLEEKRFACLRKVPFLSMMAFPWNSYGCWPCDSPRAGRPSSADLSAVSWSKYTPRRNPYLVLKEVWARVLGMNLDYFFYAYTTSKKDFQL